MPIFLPQFSCPLRVPASFVRVGGGFDQPPPVPHPRPSLSFFLPTSGGRHSASVSEILNVASIRSLSTDVRHPFRITTPETRTPGARTPGIRTWGSETPGIRKRGRRKLGLTNLRREKRWACSPRHGVEPSDITWNRTSSGYSGYLPALRPGTDACQVSRRAV